MRSRDEQLDQILEEALAEIRDERPDSPAEQGTLDRVWSHLRAASGPVGAEMAPSAEPIRSCEGFRALLGELLDGRLSPARRLLVQDHLGECVRCRRAQEALHVQRGGTVASTRVRRPARSSLSAIAWRGAAAAAIAFAVIGFTFESDVFSYESGGLIRIEAVDGELFRVTDDGTVPLAAGEEVRLERGEEIRTAKDSAAVIKLADDSQVEMRERSELAVRQRRHLLPGRRADGVIDLGRGSIIVEASEQGSGHLYVDTDECRVAVTGTVFSVSHGMKGSRVSVIDGEVRVGYAGGEDVLLPGQQATTRPALDPVPVAADISWSRNRRAYLEILAALGAEIDEVLKPELRYSRELLDLVPANTAVYVAIPNLSGELSQAYDLLRQRVAANEILRDFWEQSVMDDDNVERIFDEIRVMGDPLGPEVVMTLGTGPDGMGSPLFLSRLEDPARFRSRIEEQLAKLGDGATAAVQLLEGPLPEAAPDGGAEVSFWLRGDLLAVATDFDRLRELDDAVAGRAGSRLAGSAFHTRLTDLYRDGVEWVVAADLELLLSQERSPAGPLEELGLSDVQHLIGERKQLDGMTQNRVELSFAQPRRRLAAWLAAPAPMGSLDYIGPDANLAIGFVTKDPTQLVQELFDFVGRSNPNFAETLARFEAERGIDILRDVAAPLGGEFAVALDGPLLPTPSWKLVLEVYDPARLEQTLEGLVEQLNTLAAEQGHQGLSTERQEIGGRRFLRMSSPETGIEVHLVFDAGYLIAAPSRGLLDRALQAKQSGVSLPRSSSFVHLLPQDGQLNFSGVLYQNIGSILAPLSQTVSRMHGMDAGSGSVLEGQATEARPGLALLYGENDRIVLSSRSEGGLFSAGLRSLAGLTDFLGVQQSVARTLEHEGHGSHP